MQASDAGTLPVMPRLPRWGQRMGRTAKKVLPRSRILEKTFWGALILTGLWFLWALWSSTR